MDDLRIGMSDNDVLAHYREECPSVALGRAKEVYRTWLKFRHLGALAAASTGLVGALLNYENSVTGISAIAHPVAPEHEPAAPSADEPNGGEP
jgi:hypothetical protein